MFETANREICQLAKKTRCTVTNTLEVQKKVSTPLLFRFQKSTEARLFGPDQDIHTGSSTRLVNNAVEDGEGEKRPNSKNMTKKPPKKTKDKQH